MQRSTKYKTCVICGLKDLPLIKTKVVPGVLYNGEEMEYVFDHCHDIEVFEEKLRAVFKEMDILSHTDKQRATQTGYEYFVSAKTIQQKFEELNKKAGDIGEIIERLKKK
jgi:phosphoribosyl-dephospho-CoA transferase